MGIYFLEVGANQRQSKALYDRSHSAIAEAKPSGINWDKIFDKVSWFHITGIILAISLLVSELYLEAVKKTREKGRVIKITGKSKYVKIEYLKNHSLFSVSRMKSNNIIGTEECL